MLKAQLIGNLGRDAEVKEINEAKVIDFPVAHNERYRDSSGTLNERTVWVNCNLWRRPDPRTGEINVSVAQYLIKGKQVFIEGDISARGYLNSNGEPAAGLDIRVRNLQLLGGSQETGEVNAGPAASQEAPAGYGSEASASQSAASGQQHEQDQSGGGSGEQQPEDDLPF